MSKTEDLSWQGEYATQLRRASGLSVRFERAGGGWWTMYVDGSAPFRKQRSEVQVMTRTLQSRKDYVPSTDTAVAAS